MERIVSALIKYWLYPIIQPVEKGGRQLEKEIVSGILVTSLLMCMLTLAFNTRPILAEPEAILYVDPAETKALVGSDFTVNVTVADVVDLYGFGFCLGYNTSVLDVSNVLVHRPFESPIIKLNGTKGYVCVIAALPPDYPKLSGTFSLTSVTFRALFPGSSILNLYDTVLIGAEIEPMPHTTIDGSVTVYAPELLLETDKSAYRLGENVTITLANIGKETVRIGGYPAWQIHTYPEEEPVYPMIFAWLAWSLEPGESDTFSWNQYNEFTQSPAEPGTYVVRDTQGWGLSAYFEILDQWLPYVPDPDQVELSYWSVRKIAYVNVTLTFGTPCYEFDWGTVSRDDRQLWADAKIWQYQGGCILVVTTFEHTYELGKLKYGKTYTFTFKAWGFPVESITFKHLPQRTHFHQI